MFVPSILLKQLYTHGSLTKTDNGVSFALKNRLKDATLKELKWISFDGEKVPSHKISIQSSNDSDISFKALNDAGGMPFSLRQVITVHLELNEEVSPEKRKIGICFSASPFGKLKFEVEDNVTSPTNRKLHIPRDDHDDYGDKIIKQRQSYFESFTGAKIDHVGKYSVDPDKLKGNIEHFIGVAQVPIGIAGPLTIHGEHAKGDLLCQWPPQKAPWLPRIIGA